MSFNPPSDIPYKKYNFPNFRETPISLKQSDTGFGVSNFRVSASDGPNAINQSKDPSLQRLSSTSELNFVADQPFARSEKFLFRDKFRDHGITECMSTPDDHVFREVLGNTVSSNPLTELFLSQKNLDHVIRLACKLVYVYSNNSYKITPESQNKSELLTVLRSIYFQVQTDPYSPNLEIEVCRLNRAVLDWVVPRMLVNIQSHLGYVRDASTRRLTMPRAQSTSVVGTKTNKFYGGRFM